MTAAPAFPTRAPPRRGPRTARVAVVLRTLSLVAGLAVASRAHAAEGFVIGLEGGRGNWSAPLQPLADQGVNFGDAALFTNAFHDLDTNGFGLFFGWNFKGHAALTLSFSGTAWEPFQDGAGGVGLGGARLQWYPLELFLPSSRRFDVALEFGGGYSIAGGPSRGMVGPYFSAGGIVEFMPVPWFGVAIFYRQHFFRWNTFLYHFSDWITGDVPDYTGLWGTPGVQLSFRFPPPG